MKAASYDGWPVKLFCYKIGESGGAQTGYQVILDLTPQYSHWAVLVELAAMGVFNTFIEENGAINGFNNIQHGDILRVSRKRNAAACTT